MKNKLPDFPSKEGTLGETIAALWNYNVNLHDYLAELSEVVEGTQDRDWSNEEFIKRIKEASNTTGNAGGGPSDKHGGGAPITTLKETVLREITKKNGYIQLHPKYDELFKQGYRNSFEDVEAIVNRLMP